MNFTHLLSGAGGRSTDNREMGPQGLLKLGQKRGNDHLIDHTTASQVTTRRRLDQDPEFSSTPLPSRPHLASLSLLRSTSSSTPSITQMAGFGDTELPSGYTFASEKGFEDSEYNKQQLYSVHALQLESMRRALGKDLPQSGKEMGQNAAKKFTMNGEQVDKITENVSSESHQDIPVPAPCLNTKPRGSFSLSPYVYETGILGPDKVFPPYPNSTLSRGFYQSCFPDLRPSNNILGQNTINDLSANSHTSAGLKIRRHTTDPGTLSSVTSRRKHRDGSNIFPANVKSLLSTGIFDGISVKYVSWDRTKTVRGTIQGTSYLCWCKECKRLKLVNAYQLEQHAGSKSKHPNDHIYFPNGKSIYGVVQELKSTPSDKLLDVIPTVTGCGINKENFSKWKESFQAAGRELHRIFGSDPEPGEN